MLTVTLLLGGVVAWLVSVFVRSLRGPSAPGPYFARFSNYWFMFKAWGGEFELWEIAAHKAYGPVVRVAPSIYSIDSPEAARKIYGISSKMHKSDWYKAWGDPSIPNFNIFSSTDRGVHSQMRKRVAGLYSMSTIKSYEAYVNECIGDLLQNLDSLAQKNEAFDLQEWMQYYAFDVISNITWGWPAGFLENGGRDINNIISTLRGSTTKNTILGISRVLSPILSFVYGNPLGVIKGFVGRMETRKSSNQAQERKTDPETRTFSEKLSLVREESPQDYKKYRMETTLFSNVAAGSDTTSISLTAVLSHICESPRVFAKLQEELREAISSGRVSKPVTFEQANALPYFQLVVKEAFRVHPAVGLPLWREVEDVKGVEIEGTVFPPKSVLGINPWVAHANKAVFGEDADEFRPERWDPEQISKEKLTEMDHYYMPFGLGTRTCLGRHIGHLEICKLVPEILRRYELHLQTGNDKRRNHWFVFQKDVTMRLVKREVELGA